MTDTFTPATLDSMFTVAAHEPLEDLFRDRGLKVLYWHVGEPVDDEPEATETFMVTELSVVFTNGVRPFRSNVILDLAVVYGLVGQDDLNPGDAEFAVEQLLDHSHEIDQDLSHYAEDQEWADALSDWIHTDADLVRGAAAGLDDDFGALLVQVAELMDRMPSAVRFTSPEAQIAAVATRIAVELL